MKKCIFSLSLLLVLTLLPFSCAKDIIEVNGEIMGVVKDATDGHFIANCQVSIASTGASTITGADGSFSFLNIEPDVYTLSFKKSGYFDESKNITLIAGQTQQVNVLMQVKSALSISTNSIDFGDLSSADVVSLTNNTDQDCNYSITNIPSWATVVAKSGTIAKESSVQVAINIDRDKVAEGTFKEVLLISYSNGRTSGTEQLELKMQKVILGKPSVTIDTLVTEKTQTSFKVKGNITATGGAAITSYGHCWSLSHNPTIDDTHSNYGATTKVTQFETTITNLQLATTYYVRAYATNSQGTSYSDELVVTTLDAPSTKWDGKIATSFAGGSGTLARPYLVETGGQLLLMKDYSNKYFKLVCNIDLDNKNWKPYEFSGHLDGDGYTILNLYVNRSDKNQGLFSTINNNYSVKNVNIKGVNIKSEQENIGALVGTSHGTIENVHIFLTENSYIEGDREVGGLVGWIHSGKIQNCSVYSVDNKDRILGSSYIGGVIGSSMSSSPIESCKANVSISGNTDVGGIVGANSYDDIFGCLYSGNIKGEKYIGGICGRLRSSGASITACKVDANITGNSDHIGGILGYSEYFGGQKIIACYSMGVINRDRCGILGNGYSNSCLVTYLCYSTMSSGISTSYGSPHDCASTGPITSSANNCQGYCTNITQHLQEAYSQYAEYYNFDNTWTWEGEIQGKKVQVSCPKLSWEK